MSFRRMYMHTKHPYICVFCTHIYACFVCTTHIYAFKVFSEKYYIGLEPIYHKPILKQMANHITWVMALLIEIQHIPLQKDDSHQMLCMRQALVYHILWNCI